MRRTLRAVSRGEPLHPPEPQTGCRTSCSIKTGEEAVPQRISLHSTPRRSPPPETGPLYLTFMLSLSGRGKEKDPGSLGYAGDDTKDGRRKERLSIRANLTPSPFPCGKGNNRREERPGAILLEPQNPHLPAATRPASSDRKSTRLNSRHLVISYAVFCL